MSSLSRRPLDGRLAPFVGSLWYYEGSDPEPTRERVMPVGFMQILVNLHDDVLRWWDGEHLGVQRTIRGVGIGGLRRRSIGLDTRDQIRIAGVEFAPAGAAPWLGVPASTLADLHVELTDLWGPAARRLRERLLEARSPAEVLARLEAALVERLEPGSAHTDVMAAAAALAHGSPLAELERTWGLSPRRFRDRFAAAVGCAPKQFARIERLQRALRARALGASWTDVSYQTGYYDQAHMIREFRDLAGMRPSDYRPRPDGANHVPLEAPATSVSSKPQRASPRILTP